jgi:hypothetical protein
MHSRSVPAFATDAVAAAQFAAAAAEAAALAGEAGKGIKMNFIAVTCQSATFCCG